MARWIPIRQFLTFEEALVEISVLESAGIIAISPEIKSFESYPSFAIASNTGFRVMILDGDTNDAQSIFANLSTAAGTSYPCPE
jgi:hypothetical protein